MSPATSRSGVRRRVGVASAVVVVLVAGLFTWFAVQANGETVRKADLNDGGIWVTNSVTSTFGRLNKPAQQLDAGVALAQDASASGVDVLQDGSAVLGLSKASNQVTPVNAASATISTAGALTLPAPAKATGLAYAQQLPVDLRGGSVAVVDPSSGKLWAGRVDTAAGSVISVDQLQPQVKPLATVGGTATVAVGADGTVYAASAAKGDLVTVPVDPATGAFGKPVTAKLGFTSKAVEVTAVGSRWVAFDPATSRLYAAGLDKPVDVSDAAPTGTGGLAQAALQVPGPDAASVLVATAEGLQQIALDGEGSSDAVVALPDAARRTTSGDDQKVFLTAPVRLGDCAHGAWAGPATVWYGRACGAVGATADGEKKLPQAVQLGTLGKGTRVDGVKLRTNRGLIVLNDLDSGNLWDIDNTPVKIDNWDSVIPPPEQQDENTKKDPNQVDDQVVKTPPQAQPDEMRVRAGRTSTLHVLDNDSDAAGSILGIAPGDVTQPSASDVTATVSADGQTVEVAVPTDVSSRTFGFDYTVNNGSGGATSRSKAHVSVEVVDDSVNTAPAIRKGTATLSAAKYAVVASGHVTVGVVADWRDGENDPLSVEAIDSGVGVDPSGALTVTAGTKAGPLPVKYRISDGRGGVGEGQASVTVLGDTDRAVPPVSQPDVVRAIVGKPVQVEPLGNDVPGADPTSPDARMQLAAPVRGPGQLSVDTNLDTDVVTVAGTVAGTFFLTYGAQVGTAVGSGRIRVDVLPDPQGDPPPVAVPDAASLKAELPVVSDVLANDYSPRGDVLVVQKVTTDDAWVRASVVQGRFVRLQATGPLTEADTRAATLTYTVSDGSKTAAGQLSVVQKKDDGKQLVPNVVDDEAVVRTGDVVSIPVLDNDTVSGGVPLVLDPTVKVVDGKGSAFASGSVVRFVPDAIAVTEDTVVTLEYSTHPEGGTTSVTGRVQVTVKPLPTPTTPDQAPVARSFSASVTAGDTITLTVPTSGIDPDGDLGYVVGVVGAQEGAIDLSLGRVTSTGAATIRYEAYPRSAGTELIRYSIRDRYNKTGEGIIRVGIVQPGDPQPPVAVEDDVVAAPGRTVTFDPMANDLVAPDDEVDYEDLAARNDAALLKGFTRAADGTFATKVPAEDEPKVLNYGITDGLFDPSRSTVTVRGQKGFNNAPIAVDDTPQPKAGETSIAVDVLANDHDPDSTGKLSVVSATGQGVTVAGGRVTVALLDHPRVVPYVVTDNDPDDPKQALALIYVPTADSGVPFPTAGKVISMKANSTLKVDLSQYVTDPRGRTVRVTSPETVSTSPRAFLGQSLTGAAEVTLTSKGDYTGPAALMLQVTDSTGDADTAPATAYLSLPVQVGPLTPVLRCPAYGVSLVADGPARTVDIPRLCHAWFPTGLDPATVSYAASWAQQPGRVDLRQQGTGGSQLVLEAQPAAPAATGAITYGVKGGQQFTLGVRVSQAPPLSVRPITVAGLVAGQSQAVDVGRYLDSPLSDPQCALTGVRTLDNSAVTVATSGCRITVTAAASARRTATIGYTVSDAPGRSVDGRIAVTIKAPPDAPVGVSAVADKVAGGQARVTWSPPPYDGGFPVDSYRVTATGQKTQVCTASPCTITGLRNGVDVRFTVAAHNAVDWSPESPASNVARPDKLPGRTAVGAVTAGDRTLTVRWSPPAANGGSAVTKYQIFWVDKDGGSGGGSKEVVAGQTSYTIGGLTNDDRYGITIRARNDLGYGPPGAEVVKQSVGTPATVPAPRVAARTPGPDDDNAQLTVSWDAVDPNGPAITGYTVYRDGTKIAQTSPGTRTVADSVPFDGRTHQYSVTATNGGNKTSAKGPSAAFKADGVPQTPSNAQATTPAADYAAQGTWQIGSSRSSGYREVQWRTDAGRGSFGCSGQSCPTSGRLANLGTSTQSLQIRVVNAAGTSSAWSPASNGFQPYGPTKGVTGLRETGHTDDSITFAWDATPDNGRPVTGYRLGGDASGTVTGLSYTFSGLTYSTTRTITVTAVADTSGAGPTSGAASGTTNPKPPDPKVVPVQNGSCYASTCNPQNPAQCNNSAGKRCEFVAIAVTDWVAGRTYCTITDSPNSGGIPGRYHADTGTSGTFQLYNDSNYRPFYGQGGHTVTVTCTDPSGGTHAGSAGGW